MIAAALARLEVCERLESGLLGRRLPFPPEKPVHPRIRYLAIHDAIFAQRALSDKAELFQHTARRVVARVCLGLNAVQVQGVQSPLQQSAGGLGRKASAPCRV